MTNWAIIPVKPLTRAKSRLAGILSPEERQVLAERLMRHVVTTVSAARGIHGVLVISRDPHALALARDLGANTVQESGAPELNSALMRATQVITAWRGRAVLVLPADLPLVTSDDVSAMLDMGREEGCLVIAPDRNNDGTNALFTRPPGLIAYAYGEGSFQRHVGLAQQIGATVRIMDSPRLALDIDVPADLASMLALRPDFELPFDLAARFSTQS
ncbi:MAG: 2-phospho-L-lactate guanylyltransferase [Pleurocapsa minor GSE-CHR-MK-17-07R]|jgi:2-phospho-L-lactate guanylyltransferase|nr:2-phospho-L-lactate guanylyltransferase [Pleurocapsa minor GSE-CHR-MK 17-07R]